MADVGLESVTKRFGQTVAIDHLSIKVDDGSFVVLSEAPAFGFGTTKPRVNVGQP